MKKYYAYFFFFFIGFFVASLVYNLSITFAQKEDFYSLISSAKTNIYVAVFSFTDVELSKLIVKKHKQGVDVKVVVDSSSFKNKAVSYLITNGVPVRIFPSRMHAKLLIVDNNIIIGSHNFSYSAFNKNVELSLMFNPLYYLFVNEARDWFMNIWVNSSPTF